MKPADIKYVFDILLLREVLLGLFGSNSSSNSEQDLHRQQNIQGAATSKRGEATKSRTTKPAKIPMTWVR